MGQYLTEDKDGNLHNIGIKGDAPSPTEMARIQEYLAGLSGPQAATPSDSGPGVLNNMGQHLKRAGTTTLGGVADVLGWGLSKLPDEKGELGKQIEELHGYGTKKREEAAAIPVTDKGFFEEKTLGGKLASLAGTFAESLPAMAAGVTTGIVTKSPALAMGAASLFGVPQAMESNVQRQIEQHGYVKDWDKAGVSAVAQGLIEGLPDLVTLKMAGVFGRVASKVAVKPVIDRAVKRAFTEVIKKGGKGALAGFSSNAFEESLQAGAERWQADLALLDDDAKKEYIENAIVGGILGAGFGAAGGAIGGIGEYRTTHAKEERDKEIKDAIADTEAETAAGRAERTPTSPATYASPPAAPEKTEEDHSATVAAAATPVAETESLLPKGLRDAALPEPSRVDAEPVIPDDHVRFYHGGYDPAAGGGRFVSPQREYAANFRNESGLKPLHYVDVKKGSPEEIAARMWDDIDEKHGSNNVGTYGNIEMPEHVAKRMKPLKPVVVTQPKAAATPTPTVPTPSSPFTETDYKKAVAELHGKGNLSPAKVTKAIKIEKAKAEHLLAEMLRRGDAKPSGSKNQYVRVIAPEGKPQPVGKPPIGEVPSRGYSIKPVAKANAAPFTVEMNGKKRSPKSFQSQQEALDWIDKNVPQNQKKSVSVATDPAAVEYGIHEQAYTTPKGGLKTLSGERLLTTHATEAEAKEALKSYDPAFSPETNKKSTPTPEEKKAEVDRDVKATLGPYKLFQGMVDRMVGPDRARVDVTGTINDAYMAAQGHPIDPKRSIDNAVVEGVTFGNKDASTKAAFQQIISLANTFADPNLSEDEKNRRIAAVLNHEVIHAIRNLNLLTPDEWDALLSDAISQKVPGKSYTWAMRAQARNPGLSRAKVLEEAVAEMFRHYINDPSAFQGQTRSLLGRIAEFVKKLIGLGRKHDAKAVMDAIFGGEVGKRPVNYGGLPARNESDVWYSLLKPDNFYLGTHRLIVNSSLQEASPKQWLGMIRNAKDIKPAELSWLGIEQWLSEQTVASLPKQEVLKQVDASSGIDVTIRAPSDHPELGKTFKRMGPTDWETMQTAGGQDYAEAVFTFRDILGEPTYQSSHYPEDNILAHARFKTVFIGEGTERKKYLFIEEMQSDLHQDAIKAGGYFSDSLYADKEAAWKEYETAKMATDAAKDLARADFREMQQRVAVKEEALRQTKNKIHDYIVNRALPPYGSPPVEQILTKLRADQVRLQAELDKLNDITYTASARDAEATRLEYISSEKYQAWNAINRRLGIPNAPFKTNWEDYVIKRMARHGVEHGFDGIAWHGQKESVADAEQWGGVTESIDFKRQPPQTASWRPIPNQKTYTVDDGFQNGVNVSPIVNRYLEKLPRILEKLAGRFGAQLVLEDATALGDKAGPTKNIQAELPPLESDDDLQAAFPTPGSIKSKIMSMEGLERYERQDPLDTPERTIDQAQLIDMFKTAYQAARNMRNYDAATAFHKAGLISLDDSPGIISAPGVRDALIWTSPNATWNDVEKANGSFAGTTDAFPWKHYRLDFNEQMKEGFERGDVPMFSQMREAVDRIEADPRFQQWFSGSVVTDPNGKPKVVFHYTNADQDFGRFNTLTHFGTAQAAEERQAGSVGDDNLGRIHKAFPELSVEDRRQLYYENYAEPTGQRIYPVLLNIRRPLEIQDTGKAHRVEDLVATAQKANQLTNGEVIRILGVAAFNQKKATGMLVKALEKAGFDGFRYTNAVEDKGSTSYVSFRPEQIKSVFNQGTWDETNPDINYSKMEERGRDLWQNDDKFKQWFSGSRVVDEDGNPFLMFHGTSKDKDFDKFKTGRRGAWFTDDPNEASSYAETNDSQNIVPDPKMGDPWAMKRVNTASRVIPTFLSIKNPYKPTALDHYTLQHATNYAKAQADLFDRVKRDGYDGVDFDNGIWIAFEPGQIKSALSMEFSAESDSFKFSMMMPTYAATGPLGTRVPAVPPPDALDAAIQKATYNNLAPFLQRTFRTIGATKLAAKVGVGLDPGIEGSLIQLQDYMLSMGKLVDHVRKNGGIVTTGNDPYLQQALMSGQMQDRIEDNERLLYQPLAKAMHALTVSIRDAEELGRLNDAAELITAQYIRDDHRLAMSEVYLYAQHAKERNAEMAIRNAKFRLGELQQTEGSGMSDFEAQQILDWFSSKSFGRKFNSETDANSVRSLYRKIIANTNHTRLDGHLTPDFTTMTYDDGSPIRMYLDYAPLRGHLNDHPYSAHEDNTFARTGLGFNIRGKEDKSAAGRAALIMTPGGPVNRSLGAHLIANAILQNEEAIVRAAKNKVDLAFYEMLKANPATMGSVAVELTPPLSKWTYNSKTGNVQLQADPTAPNDPNVLKFKEEGKQKYIRFFDDRLAKAMGAKPNLGGDGLGHAMLRGMRAFNRYFAMMVTSLNPEFTVSNFQKDMGFALVNLSEHEAAGLKTKVIKSIPSAYQGAWRAIRKGDRTSPMAKAYWEFKARGGMTSTYGLVNLEDTIRKTNAHMRMEGEGSNLVKAGRAMGAGIKLIEDWNLAVENTTRLCVYVAMRDHYLSLTGDPTNPVNIQRAQEQAAFVAKRKTVDFNMGGEMKQVFNSMWVFYGASISGTMALVNPLIRSRKMKQIWGAVAVAGMVQEMLNSLISPEDDDGEKTYDKIKDHILEHNMVLIDPFGITDRGYIKIPMPYGFNGIFNFGRATARGLRGKYSPGEAANSALGTLTNSFNPLGESNTWINWVSPTILDPVVDLAFNEDFTGTPIAPAANPYGPEEVASQRYWNNTSPAAIFIADQLSRLTGRQGDYLPGAIEVSPNHLAYVVGQLTGGLGAMTARAYNFVAPEAMLGKGTAMRMAAGDFEDVEVNDIPFVRRVAGNITSKNDLQEYIKERDKVLLVRTAVRDARKDGNGALAKEIREKHPDEFKVSGRVNAIENARKKISSKIKKVRDGKRPQDQKDEIIKRLKERQDKLVGIANRVMEAADIN